MELIAEAVSDAKANALFNNCSNADFFVGKAEDILSSVVARSKNEDVIAIVDPPRSGLRKYWKKIYIHGFENQIVILNILQICVR